jgi:hypothetical protein
MKKLFVLTMVAMLLLAISVAYAKDYEISKKAGDLTVVVRIDKNPPVAGPNNVEVSITDTSAKAVTDAKVALTYSMPAMPGMPAMSYKTDLSPAGNVYKGKINYSMSGSWNNELKITRGGKMVSTRFSVDAK